MTPVMFGYPNITGGIGTKYNNTLQRIGMTGWGCFSPHSAYAQSWKPLGSDGTSVINDAYAFQASSANSIYHNKAHVQPLSLTFNYTIKC